MSMIKYEPAEIVKIKVEELTAPVMAGVEMSKLYLMADKVIADLVQDIETDEETGRTIIPPDLLPWFKEQRFLLSEIYKMTGEVQQRAQLKKMELATKIFEQYFKEASQAEKIKIIKELKNGQQDDSEGSRD